MGKIMIQGDTMYLNALEIGDISADTETLSIDYLPMQPMSMAFVLGELQHATKSNNCFPFLAAFNF